MCEMNLKEQFDKLFECGATCVYEKDGGVYFFGDILHNGKQSIFHNARLMRAMMLDKKCKFAHMNYNDFPTFNKKGDLEYIERERKSWKEDLYYFDGNIIKVFDLVGEKEQDQIYFKQKCEEKIEDRIIDKPKEEKEVEVWEW